MTAPREQFARILECAPFSIARGHEGYQLMDRVGSMWCDGMGSSQAGPLVAALNALPGILAERDALRATAPKEGV